MRVAGLGRAWCGVVLALAAGLAGPLDAVAQPEPPAGGPAATASAPSAAPRSRWFDQPARPERFRLGSLEPGRFPFELELTSEGAAVGTLKLASYYATVADKKLAGRYAEDPQKYHQELAAHGDKYGGHYSLLNPVDSGGQRYLPLATRSVSFWLPGANEPVVWSLEGRHWTCVQRPDPAAQTQTIRFEYTILHDPGFDDPAAAPRMAPLLTVAKTYAVRRDDHSVELTLELINQTDGPLRVALEQYGPTGVPAEEREDRRAAAIGKLRDGDIRLHLRERPALKDAPLDRLEPVGYAQEPDHGQSTLWVGVVSKFFGSMMYLVPPEANRLDSAAAPVRFSVAAVEENPSSRTFLTSVSLGVREAGGRAVPAPVELAPGGVYALRLDVFAGPKKRDLFSNPRAPLFKPLYKQLDYLSTISFGGCFCASSALSLAMMWLLEQFSRLALGNYGVAIILLVALMRLVLHPLTKKSQVMMARTQKLAPQMQKLKEQHAGDKDTLQREMMKLYKQQGFTPLLGCLPMVLQMPIWVALWGALNAAVELRHAAFLPVWLTDLAAPDALLSFSWSVPFLGNSLNLLPILVAVSMFFQSKLNPQMSGAGPAATPEQLQQQKMMQYMMPGMMLVLFYQMPSGLNLYIMTSTFAGLAEQHFIRKHIRAREEAEAARTTTVRVPGKAPRASRPKKPKGPMWFKRS